MWGAWFVSGLVSYSSTSSSSLVGLRNGLRGGNINTRREVVRIADETEGQRMRRLQGKKKEKAGSWSWSWS
jgi:hypothetical protein